MTAPTGSDNTAKLIDDEVRRVLAEAHARVVRTLVERREQLDRIARRLLECEVPDRETLLKLLTENEPAAEELIRRRINLHAFGNDSARAPAARLRGSTGGAGPLPALMVP